MRNIKSGVGVVRLTMRRGAPVLALLALLVLLAPAARAARCPTGRADTPAPSEAEVRALQRAALAAGGFGERPLPGTARLRMAALVPSLRVSLGEGSQLSYRNDVEVPDLSGRRSLQIGLRWDLAGLLFHPQEPQLRRQHLEEMRAASALGREVARLFYERRRLLTGRSQRVAALTAELDALTGLCGLPTARTEPATPAEAEEDEQDRSDGPEPTAAPDAPAASTPDDGRRRQRR